MPATKSEVWHLLAPEAQGKFTGTESFYDGSLNVVNGVIAVPKGRRLWVNRLLSELWRFASSEDAEEYLADSN